jgi:hypothetical protein
MCNELPKLTGMDAVDRILQQWHEVRPDLDSSPIAVIGRLSRLSAIVDRRLAENFARHDLETWMYDVLATLSWSWGESNPRPSVCERTRYDHSRPRA